MPQHVLSPAPASTTVVCQHYFTTSCTGSTSLSEYSISLPWLSTGVSGIKHRCTSPTATTAFQCPMLPVAGTCDPPAAINWLPRDRYSTFGCRSFASAGPTVWNSLPNSQRNSAVGPEQFRRTLKTRVPVSLLLAFHWQCVRGVTYSRYTNLHLLTYLLTHKVLHMAVQMQHRSFRPDITWRRPRGRPRSTWLQQLTDDIGISASRLWDSAADQSEWAAVRPVAGFRDWLIDWMNDPDPCRPTSMSRSVS